MPLSGRARPAALSQRSRDAHELALGGEFETLLRRCRTALSAYPLFARLRGRFLNARIAIFCIFGKKRPGRPLTWPAPPSGFCPHLFEHTGKKHSTQTGEGGAARATQLVALLNGGSLGGAREPGAHLPGWHLRGGRAHWKHTVSYKRLCTRKCTPCVYKTPPPPPPGPGGRASGPPAPARAPTGSPGIRSRRQGLPASWRGHCFPRHE